VECALEEFSFPHSWSPEVRVIDDFCTYEVLVADLRQPLKPPQRAVAKFPEDVARTKVFSSIEQLVEGLNEIRPKFDYHAWGGRFRLTSAGYRGY
jgi:hypothetical protein